MGENKNLIWPENKGKMAFRLSFRFIFHSSQRKSPAKLDYKINLRVCCAYAVYAALKSKKYHVHGSGTNFSDINKKPTFI